MEASNPAYRVKCAASLSLQAPPVIDSRIRMSGERAHHNRRDDAVRSRVIRSRSILRRVAAYLSKFAALLVVLLVVTQADAAPFDLAGSDWEGCAELVR